MGIFTILFIFFYCLTGTFLIVIQNFTFCLYTEIIKNKFYPFSIFHKANEPIFDHKKSLSSRISFLLKRLFTYFLMIVIFSLFRILFCCMNCASRMMGWCIDCIYFQWLITNVNQIVPRSRRN